MLSFVGSRGSRVECEPAMICFRLRLQVYPVFSVFITWGRGGGWGGSINSRFQSTGFKHQLYKICKRDHVELAI